jgi:hypothetical protein
LLICPEVVCRVVLSHDHLPLLDHSV